MKVAIVTLATLAALSSSVSAQPATDPATRAFEANLAAYEARMRDHFFGNGRNPADQQVSAEEIATESPRVETRLDRVRATPALAALQPENATTAADKLAAAISTDAEGTEAGITVSPAKLFGDETSALAGLTLTVASLEEGGARGGVGWTHALDASLEPDELELEQCDVTPVLEAARKLRDPYLVLCSRAPFSAYPAGDSPSLLEAQKTWVGVALACGRPDGIPSTFSTTLVDELQTGDQLFVRIRDLVAASKGIVELDAARAALENWDDFASKTSCHSDEQVAEAVADALWDRARAKFGVAIHGDMFARLYGFKPDPDEALPRGELKAAEAHLEAEFALRRYTLTVGFGAGYSREEPGDDFERTLAPNIGLRMLITRLDDKALETAILDEDAPVLALGLTASGKRTLDKPDNQETAWTEVEVTAFADFKVSKELAFRIGVPLKAELATREADDDAMPPVAEKKGLQWSLPVFVATVLKL